MQAPKEWISARGHVMTAENFHRKEFEVVFRSMTDEETFAVMHRFFPGMTSAQIGKVYRENQLKDAKEFANRWRRMVL